MTGETEVTATATDACGLMTTDTFTVNINPGKVTNQMHSVKMKLKFGLTCAEWQGLI